MRVDVADGKPMAVQPQVASDWISIRERLPDVGQAIWARFAKKNGEPRKRNPVVEGNYVKEDLGDGGVTRFVFGVHRNWLMSVEYATSKQGLTHWQPRLDGNMPSPLPPASDPAPQKVRSAHRWTREEDLKLWGMHGAGKSYHDLEAEMGLSYSQLAQRMHRLRNSPALREYRLSLAEEVAASSGQKLR